MSDMLTPQTDRLLEMFDRLRKLVFGQHPAQIGGMTIPQITLLTWIAAAPGCGIQDIATGLGLTAPTVSVSVRRLEEAGLVERQPDPQDGRAVRLFLSPQGKALHAQTRAFRRQKIQRLLRGLTPDEQRTLLDLLDRAIKAAEAEQDKAAQTPKTARS